MKGIDMKFIAVFTNLVDAVEEFEVFEAASYEAAVKMAAQKAGLYFIVTSVKEVAG